MFSIRTLCLLHLPLVLIAALAWNESKVVADEGMHPISEIARLDLQSHGLRLTAGDIFSPDQICLVDGICRVNGCTGSFVSNQGLIITNHHCAYEAIQNASTTEHDYLADGFRAAGLEQEVPAKGYTVRITESFSDVSDQVLAVVAPEMTFSQRTRAIEKRQKEIEKEAEAENPGMRAEVAEMFTGKTYFLFLYTYIKDVRLVFAPPASVGNFGGDVDNWEWPRHTGDFSFMRAYVAADGSSADYSPDNVPYQPKRFIQVSPAGVDEGDFVFLLGYPGRTARHNTASFLEYEQYVRLPYIVDLYGWQIETIETASADDRSVALKMASTKQSLANVEKRSRGQLRGLLRARFVESRRAAEGKLQEFIEADPQRNDQYGDVLQEIDAVYQEMSEQAPLEMNLQSLRSACRMIQLSFLLYDAAVERQKPDLERESPYMDRNWDQTVQRSQLGWEQLHVPTDQLMLAHVLQRLSSVAAAHDIDALKNLLDSDESMSAVEQLYAQTKLTDFDFFQSCFEQTPNELAAAGDPFLNLASQLYPKYLEMRETGKAREGRLSQLYGSLIDIKKEFLQTQFVPDANGTLRLTFGHVKGYSPQDAVYKSPITTLAGVVEKTTGETPFETPQRILDLHAERKFGPFAHERLDDIPVAILYDTDTTGGNSGSPILNAEGELVGVNFDRTFEATINDFAWNANYSRSLGVDIRYVLWITGTVYGANDLLHEMGVRE